MANRTRNIKLEFYVNENEKSVIDEKMAMMKTHNLSAYLRKTSIDGYVVIVDYTEVKKLTSEINHIGTNINQLCKRFNSTGIMYNNEIESLKQMMENIWQLLKSRLSKAL